LESDAAQFYRSPLFILSQEDINEAERLPRAVSAHLTEALEESVKLRTDLRRLEAHRSEYATQCDVLLSSLMKMTDESEELSVKAKDTRQECNSLRETHQNLSNILHQHRHKEEQSTHKIIELKNEQEKLLEQSKQLDIRITEQQSLLQTSMMQSAHPIESIRQHKHVVAETKHVYQLSMKAALQNLTRVNLGIVKHYHECHRIRAQLLDSVEGEHRIREDLYDLLSNKRDAVRFLAKAVADELGRLVAQRSMGKSSYEEGQKIHGLEGDDIRVMTTLAHTYADLYEETKAELLEKGTELGDKYNMMQQAVEFADSVLNNVKEHTTIRPEFDPQECLLLLQELATRGMSRETFMLLLRQQEEGAAAASSAHVTYEDLVKRMTLKVQASLPLHAESIQRPKYGWEYVDRKQRVLTRRMKF